LEVPELGGEREERREGGRRISSSSTNNRGIGEMRKMRDDEVGDVCDEFLVEEELRKEIVAFIIAQAEFERRGHVLSRP